MELPTHALATPLQSQGDRHNALADAISIVDALATPPVFAKHGVAPVVCQVAFSRCPECRGLESSSFIVEHKDWSIAACLEVNAKQKHLCLAMCLATLLDHFFFVHDIDSTLVYDKNTKTTNNAVNSWQQLQLLPW